MAVTEPLPRPETAWDSALLQSPHTVADKRQRVQKMFTAIAPSYDLNNRLHSLWMDQRWRKKAVKLSLLKPDDKVVDVACGTGDLTLKYFSQLWFQRISNAPAPRSGTNDYWPEPGQVLGVDFTFQMLSTAKAKTLRWKGGKDWCERAERVTKERVGYINGDAQSLPLPNESADVVSIAFGIRNVQDTAAAIQEFYRILHPGGRVLILEFSLPSNPIIRSLYNFYFCKVLPKTATLISGDKTGAYKYLPESVNTFIGRDQMMQMMQDAGFIEVQQFPMTFGVCVCYRGIKPGGTP